MTTAKEQPVAVAQDMPDFMRGQSGAGTEKIGLRDIETPRLKLLQSTSPEVIEKDCKAGQWWHTITEEAFPRDVEIVPLYIDTRYLLWRPMDDGGGILARADDAVHWNPANAEFKVKINKGSKEVVWKTRTTVAESRLDQWGTFDPQDPNSQPAATFMFNIVAALPEYPHVGPCVISLQRSSIRPGKKLMGKLKLAQAPSYGLRFRMGSEAETNSANQTFLVPTFTQAGFVQDKMQFDAYKDTYERFRKEGLTIRDLETAQEEAPTNKDEGPRNF